MRRLKILSRSSSFTVTVGALLVLIAVGLLIGPAGFGTGEQSAQATFLSEVKKLLASDAQADDDFGISVAVSGDTAVVGADDENAAGAVYIYQRGQGGAGNWGEVKKLTASDAQSGDNFGRSVAISGDTAVVGASGEDAGGSQAGAAYVYKRGQGGADNWGEVKKLTAPDAESGDFFGTGVAISGDTVVVGAYLDDDGGNNAGLAYVYQRDQGGADNWGAVRRLSASDAQASDFFGRSVGVSGDTAVVGADGEDAEGSLAGAAYFFGRDLGGPDNWGQLTKITASDGQAADFFGVSVAINGDTAVVGASGEDEGGSNAGAAYVIQAVEANSWREVKKLTASDAQVFVFFGSSVAISGDTPVVGANNEASGGESAGAAYLFHRDRGGDDNWGEVKKLTASDAQAFDHFGVRVAVSADTAIVGADGEDSGGEDAGAAYLFEEPPPTPTPTPKPPDGDTDGDTIPNSSDPDDDNDGCTDVAELQSKSLAPFGGGRDPHYFWDFFDTWGTGSLSGNIDGFDIGDVVLRFGAFAEPPPTKEQAFAQALTPPVDATGYHAASDRDSPELGTNVWNLGPPNGAIDGFDIAFVVAQFGHTCV